MPAAASPVIEVLPEVALLMLLVGKPKLSWLNRLKTSM